MNYIIHRRYKGKAMNGISVNIPACTELECKDNLVLLNSGPFCYTTSQVAHEHIARNDDGNGLERGKLCYEIAFANRERFNKDKTRRQRFTDEEIDLLCEKWKQFLIPDIEVILFNQDFFDADILSLRQMANELKIKV